MARTISCSTAVEFERGGQGQAQLLQDGDLGQPLPALLEQPGVLDGHGHLVGEDLHQVDFVLGKRARHRRVGVEHAQHMVPHPQRHAHQGADAPAPRHRPHTRVALGIGDRPAGRRCQRIMSARPPGRGC